MGGKIAKYYNKVKGGKCKFTKIYLKSIGFFAYILTVFSVPIRD